MNFRVATPLNLLAALTPSRFVRRQEIITWHEKVVLAHENAALDLDLGRCPLAIDANRHALPRRPGQGICRLLTQSDPTQNEWRLTSGKNLDLFNNFAGMRIRPVEEPPTLQIAFALRRNTGLDATPLNAAIVERYGMEDPAVSAQKRMVPPRDDDIVNLEAAPHELLDLDPVIVSDAIGADRLSHSFEAGKFVSDRSADVCEEDSLCFL